MIMRESIINRIDMHIDMLHEVVMSTVNADNNTDKDCEAVAYELKRIRTLKSLQKDLNQMGFPVRGSKEAAELLNVIEEMIDMDV